MQKNNHYHRKKPSQKQAAIARLTDTYAGGSDHEAQHSQIMAGVQAVGVGGEIEYDANGNPIKIKVGEGAPEEVPQRITALFQLPENLRPEVYARIAYAYNAPASNNPKTPPDTTQPADETVIDVPIAAAARVMDAPSDAKMNAALTSFFEEGNVVVVWKDGRWEMEEEEREDKGKNQLFNLGQLDVTEQGKVVKKLLYQIRNGISDKKPINVNLQKGFTNAINLFINNHLYATVILEINKNYTEKYPIIVDKSNSIITFTGEKRWGYMQTRGISLDGGGIKVYVRTENDIKCLQILLGLTSGLVDIGGEFSTYEEYRQAMHKNAINLENWEGQDGCWLATDREDYEDNDISGQRWSNAVKFNIEQAKQGRYAPFSQVSTLYQWLIKYGEDKGHEVKWAKGAFSLVRAFTGGIARSGIGSLEDGSIFVSDSLELLLAELNLGIANYAVTKFSDLFFHTYKNTELKGQDAYLWDKKFIEYEQGVVAPPIYTKWAGSAAIGDMQSAANHTYTFTGLGAILSNGLTGPAPAFSHWKASVSNAQFRIDLPLLMLYVDSHKPTCNLFKDKKADGTLSDKDKNIIRPYYDKINLL